MQVWFVHQYALTLGQPGSSRHFVLAKALRDRGYDVLVVAAGRHYQTGRDDIRYDGSGERLQDVDGVRFLWIDTVAYRGNTVWRGVNLASFMWRVCRSPYLHQAPAPDVIVGSSPQPLAALAALWIARRRRARFIYEVRDLWPRTLIDAGFIGRWHPVAALFGWSERACLRRCDAVLTVLPAATPYLEARGATKDKIRFLPNGVDLSLLPPRRNAPPGPRFRFVYAGAFGWANGLDLLLEAMAIVERDPRGADIELVLLGDGAEAAALRHRAEELGLQQVRFADAVPKGAVYDRLTEANGLIMILRDSPVFQWGVSPNKLFDYLAVGRPVVYAVRAANDPVADARCGLTADPREPASIARAMIALAGTPAPELEAMGQRARRYVETHHDLHRLARVLVEAVTGGSSS